jgi:hypothetical protein
MYSGGTALKLRDCRPLQELADGVRQVVHSVSQLNSHVSEGVAVVHRLSDQAHRLFTAHERGTRQVADNLLLLVAFQMIASG